MKTRTRTFVAFVCACCLLSSMALAQEKGQAQSGPQSAQSWVSVEPGGPAPVFSFQGGEGTFSFVSSEMSFEGKAVKGAPFSAQTVSEHVQMLANGSKIVNTSTGAIYRDSEGRTRREQQIPQIGAFSSDNEPGQMVSINDPVAGNNFILDVKNKTASKRRAMSFIMRQDKSVTVEAGDAA